MYAIGFANKYFTLWDVCESVESKEDYKILHYHYIKNISMSEDKVKELYPDTEIDTTIKGHSDFNRVSGTPKPKYDEDCFPYGKYEGQKIVECYNLDYLLWITLDENRKKYVEEALVNNFGYKYIDGSCVSPEEYDRIVNKKNNFEILSKKIENNEPIDYSFEQNLEICTTYNEDSYAFSWNIEDTPHIRIKFEYGNYKYCTYNGYEYGLPTINGKGKRVKGKTITILKYDAVCIPEDYTWEIIVHEFAILK